MRAHGRLYGRERSACIALAHVPGLNAAEHRCPGCGQPVLLGTEQPMVHALMRSWLEVAADYDLDLDVEDLFDAAT